MKKSKYLLPNLFTSANLVSGFLSMIAAHNGQYAHAALVILLAAGLDCLDGKVARLTGSSSAFGVEYDSLADLLSFGMAPGWLLYTWALRSLSPFDWLPAFAFVICGALRLARFNVQATGVQKYTFTGLPIPAAASMVVAISGAVDQALRRWSRPNDAGRICVALVLGRVADRHSRDRPRDLLHDRDARGVAQIRG